VACWVAASYVGLLPVACSCSDESSGPSNPDASADGSSGEPNTEEASTSSGGAEPSDGATGSGGSRSSGGATSGGADASTDASAGGTGGNHPGDGLPEAGVDSGAGGSVCGAPQKLEGTIEGPPFALLVMSDRSSSMVTAPHPEGWASLTAAVTTLVNDPNSRGVSVGLSSFPPLTGAADCAAGANCAAPIVPIAPLPQNAAAMISGLQAATPSTINVQLTPLECGVRGLLTGCSSQTASTGMPCAAVLFTDGEATQCNMDMATLASILSLGPPAGIKTFFIARPGSDVVALNELARAGGTSAAVLVDGTGPSLATALLAIRDGMRPLSTTSDCSWVIPSPPSGQTFAKEKLNVSLSRSGHMQDLGYVSSSADCGTRANAWHFDNANAPKEIVACPATCTSIRSVSATTEAFATFGCARRPASN
jgi:hypothetical protein